MTSKTLPDQPAVVRCIVCGGPVRAAHVSCSDPNRSYAVAMHPDCAQTRAQRSQASPGEWAIGNALPNPYLAPSLPR